MKVFNNEFVTLYNCDSRQIPIPDESVDCVVTSPPYYGLRDYGTATWIDGDDNCPHMRTTKISANTATGHKGMFDKGSVVGDAIYKSVCPKCGAKRIDNQIGLEESPEEYVNTMVEVFREVWRVLKPTGTVWLNLGDTYVGTGSKGEYKDPKHPMGRNGQTIAVNNKVQGLKQKDLIGIPWKVAFALQSDGWYLRSDIIWSKPNPMPESVKDRPTKAHEYIFLLTKNAKYYYDADAISEPTTTFDLTVRDRDTTRLNNVPGRERMSGLKTNSYETKNKRSVWSVEQTLTSKHGKYITEENEAKHRQGIHGNRGQNLVEVRSKLPKQKEFVEFLRSKTSPLVLSKNTDIPLTKIEHWFRFDDSGFAYPSIEDWEKVREFIDDWSKEFDVINEGLTFYELKTDEVVVSETKNKRSVWDIATQPYSEAHFATFPEKLIEPCILAGCPKDGVVLDPFVGSGTTSAVAQKYGRKSIGTDLNKEYLDIAVKRITSTQPRLLLS